MMTDLVAEDHMTTETSPRFLACMPFILKEEGGYSNTPGDHGGPTDFGITEYEYHLWLHEKGLPLASIRAITTDQYNAIYWQSYWMPHCPSLPAGLDLSMFNINVNGGTGRGTRLLQKCLGLTADGDWGDKTSKAVAAITDPKPIILAFHDDERQFYAAIIAYDPSQQKFASDWFGRNDRCEALSLKMASEPVAPPAVA